MRIIYIINARLPNKKAYGIQIAKMCEAFVEAGIDLELVIPRTHASSIASMKDAYQLRVAIPTTILPGLDWYSAGRVMFFLSSCVFITTSGLYLLGKRLRGERAIVYTVDMDTFSFTLLPLAGLPVVAEMHDKKPTNIFTRLFFKHAKLIIMTNTEIAQTLRERFGFAHDKYIIEPNGVDIQSFASVPSREAARQQLGISPDRKIALYVGRFYEWKGLEILADAAGHAPSIDWYVVGDTTEVFKKVTKRDDLTSNLHIAGECTPGDVPLWLAAADTLLILGTKKNEQSYRHTAPMKVYEYMAARRPVVASNTPALTSIIPQHDAVWYKPDVAESLAQAAERAIANPDPEALDRAFDAARKYSWKERVERIKVRVGETIMYA